MPLLLSKKDGGFPWRLCRHLPSTFKCKKYLRDLDDLKWFTRVEF
jgi:hypothetical protein